MSMIMKRNVHGGRMNIGKENEFIEFKKTTAEKDAGIISIASILNKHQKGVLYFGVKDNGEVCGQDVGKETLRSLSREISSQIKPPCWYQVEEKASSDGKSFIEVQFSGMEMPYSAFGRYYERFADEDRLLNNSELERLFLNRQRDYSAWENTDSEDDLDSVDSSLLRIEYEKGLDEKRIHSPFIDNKTALSKLGLLIPNKNTLNNAGKVLFSSLKPVTVKFAVFATETKSTFLKLEHFQGNVYECIEASINHIFQNVEWNISFDGSIKRNEEPEIPRIAVREIVVNAFAHGCYYGNTDFEIDVYKDRVSIYSPGLFPLGVSPDDFANKAHEPLVRNPKIINALFITAEIESFGTGFEKTFKVCNEQDVKYHYENSMSGFRFIFDRPHGQKNVHEMSMIEKQIFSIMKEDGTLTFEQISAKIGKSVKTVYRAVKFLKEQNYIKRIGSESDGYWEVL